MKLLEKILLATDFLQSAEHIFQHALEVAKKFEAEIVPIHVLPDSIKDDKARQLLFKAATHQLESMTERIKIGGVKAGNPIIEFGIHFDRIVKAAERIDANLILIGAGEIEENESYRLGTTAGKIIRESNKPVWVVKQDQPLHIKTILCPVDFSKESGLALRNALVMARRFEAKLVILSVFEKSSSVAEVPSQDWDAFEQYWSKQEDRVRREFFTQFNDFLDDYNFHGVEMVKKILDGKAAMKILEAVEKYGADLLMMGTTGRTGLSKLMMGSVTEKVIREVPCSFITTKSEDVIKLQLEQKMHDIETHYADGLQLMEDGFFKEAIDEFKNTLAIDDLHVPSLFGIAKVYDRQGEKKKAEEYRKIAREVMDRIWNSKIEAEIRKYYRY